MRRCSRDKLAGKPLWKSVLGRNSSVIAWKAPIGIGNFPSPSVLSIGTSVEQTISKPWLAHCGYDLTTMMASFYQDSVFPHGSAERRRSGIAQSSCDASAAELLLQVRRIAMDEIIHSEHRNTDDPTMPLTPLPSPPRRIFSPRSSRVLHGTNKQKLEGGLRADTSDPTTTPESRFRTVSIGSPPRVPLEPLEGKGSPFITPLQQVKKAATILGGGARSPPTRLDDYADTFSSFLVTPPQKKMPQEEDEEDSDALACCDSPVPAPPFNKKFVGDTLPQGVALKDVLRKKFSWKAFPELERFLIANRKQYLQYSNSLNYTKAQKIFNNKLTQGLLELAGEQGYIFEGFTFAAVRDRIRCFYKSFVQATKKKKGNKRGRSVSL